MMSYNSDEYTDYEMELFSQIAYTDLTQGFEALCMENGSGSYTINQIIDKQRQYCNDESLDKLQEMLGDRADEWKLAGIHDANRVNSSYIKDEDHKMTGFYSCIIETAPGKASVGFRGSEAAEDKVHAVDNVKYDWIGADVKLINSECTIQHAEIERFLLKYKDKLNSYDSVAMTGHSLGGNLAEYATIVSCSERLRKKGLNINISHCLSLDGPGFSEEFIRKYEKEIKQMAGVMKHKRWSFVGTMLNDLPDVEYKYVGGSDKENVKFNIFTKHDLGYLDFDDNGYLKEDKQDDLSIITSAISEGIDHMPGPVGDILVEMVGAIAIAGSWVYMQFVNHKDDKEKNDGLNVGGLVSGILIVLGLPALSTIALEAAAGLTAFATILVTALLYETFIDSEQRKEVAGVICKHLSLFIKWSKDEASKFYMTVNDILKNPVDYWRSYLNESIAYAESNTNIIVDASSMRVYADKLREMSNRAKKLDERMNSLYWNLGIDWSSIFDLARLLRAELLLDYAIRLDCAVRYLEETANDFDKVEADIKSSC